MTNYDVYHVGATGDRKALPTLRRTPNISWRQEYIRRSELLRRWKKSRTATILTDPGIGLLDAVAININSKFMLSSSTHHGIASRSDPFTGKVAKGWVEAVMGEGLTFGVHTSAIDADGSKIVWGMANGDVRISLLSRHGSNPRGLIRSVGFSNSDGHMGQVNDIAMPLGSSRGGIHAATRAADSLGQKIAKLGEAAHTFVTCGEDGVVKLWSSSKKKLLWSADVARVIDTSSHSTTAPDLEPSASPRVRPRPVDRVSFDPVAGNIVAALRDGTLVCWIGLDLCQLSARHSSPDKSIVHSQLAILPMADAAKVTGYSAVMLDEGIPETSQVSILAWLEGQDSFWRHDVQLDGGDGDATITSCRFEGTSKDRITALRADFDVGPSDELSATALHERKFVVVGTETGSLLVYDWDPLPSSLAAKDKASAADPIWKLNSIPRVASPTYALSTGDFDITALDLNIHYILCGSSDGTIRVFDSLTGSLVRTFADRAATRHPARMLANGELTLNDALRFRVKQIVATEDAFVAAIGSHVLAWRCEPPRSARNKLVGGKTGLSGGRSRHPLRRLEAKFQSQHELEDEVFESTESVRAESSRNQEELISQQTWRQAAAFQDMTEQEAWAYAVMLSRDEQDAGRSGSSRQLTADVLEEEDMIEIMHAIELSEAGPSTSCPQHDSESGDESASGPPVSPGPSPNSRGVSSPRAWEILANAGTSASSTPDRSAGANGAHAKVQTVQVPRRARRGPNSRGGIRADDEIGCGSPGDWPSVSSLSTSMHSSSVSSAASSFQRSRTSPLDSANASEVRRTSFAAASGSFSSSLGAWAAGSPVQQGSLRPVGNSPSLLARDLQRDGSPTAASPLPGARTSHSSSSANVSGGHGASPAQLPTIPADDQQGMDDDLRFALELSLAEERSRRQT